MTVKISEHSIQKSFVEWFKRQFPKDQLCIVAIPNARKCSYRMANYLKTEGLLPGASDILITLPGRSRMLWIEFKSEKGKLQPTQEAFLAKMKSVGCDFAVCRSVEEAIAALKAYLQLG